MAISNNSYERGDFSLARIAHAAVPLLALALGLGCTLLVGAGPIDGIALIEGAACETFTCA